MASVTGAGAGDPRPVPRTRRAHLQLLPRREVAGVSTTNPSVVASPLLAGTLLRLCPNPGSSPGLGDRLGGAAQQRSGRRGGEDTGLSLIQLRGLLRALCCKPLGGGAEVAMWTWGRTGIIIPAPHEGSPKT